MDRPVVPRGTSGVPVRALSWIEEAVGARVAHHRRLEGATSSDVYRVALQEKPGAVLRLFTNEQWLGLEPDLASHEAAALEAAAGWSVPTPELLACDPDGRSAGHPAVLMTELPGSVAVLPETGWLEELAVTLAALQEHDVPGFRWTYRVWQDLDSVSVPAWAVRPQVWERLIERVRRPRPTEENRFIHRDFHPTNVLWTGAAVTGVVDWVNACWGPPGIDVAHCRLNLAVMHGLEPADRFLRLYETLTGRTLDPVWDLLVAVEWLPAGEVYEPWHALGLEHLDTATVRLRIEGFVAAALARLG